MTGRLAALSLVLAACAGASSTTSAPRLERASPTGGADVRKDEILMLDGKILEWRKELGLEPHPDKGLVSEMHSRPAIAPAAVTPAPGEACGGVCDLADYICKAQEDICRLSTELADDPWARGKCDSAKASCSEARKRCTTCPANGATRQHRGSR